MLSRIRSRLTYSNVVASMALFIALGGVSYAAVTLPRNSVGTAQIKRNAVTGSKVKNSSLTGGDVKNSSLTGGDVKNSSLTGGDVKNSSLRGGDVRDSSLTGSDVKDGSLTAKDFSGSVQGAQGPQGPQGAQGAKGDSGVPGPVTGDLPRGTTLRGIYTLTLPGGAQTGQAWTQISFGLRLSDEPTPHIVPRGGPKPAECQGTVYLPEALPGHLCLYRQLETGLDAPTVWRLASTGAPDALTAHGGSAGRTGAYVRAFPSGAVDHNARGSWAVTAP